MLWQNTISRSENIPLKSNSTSTTSLTNCTARGAESIHRRWKHMSLSDSRAEVFTYLFLTDRFDACSRISTPQHCSSTSIAVASLARQFLRHGTRFPLNELSRN